MGRFSSNTTADGLRSMETRQPPQGLVSGRIVIEGQLPASSAASADNERASPSPIPRWKFWEGRPETVLARATVFLAIATFVLAIIAGIQAYILETTDV